MADLLASSAVWSMPSDPQSRGRPQLPLHLLRLRPALHPNIAVVHCKRPPTIDDDLFYRQTHLDGQKSPVHLGISGLSAPKPMPYLDQQGLVSLRGHQVPCIQDGHVPVFGFRLRKLMGHAIPQASECC